MHEKNFEERLKKLEECLRKLASFVSELSSELAAGDSENPAETQLEEVAASRAAQERWRSEILEEKCPRCGAPRIRKVDLMTGEEFIGCSGYPACRWRQRRRSAVSGKVAALVAATRTPPPDLSRIPF